MVAFVIGCRSPQPPPKSVYYTVAIPFANIMSQSLQKGMTEDEVSSVLGVKPGDDNMTATTMVAGNDTEVQWVVDDDWYFYFTNGKLSGWQVPETITEEETPAEQAKTHYPIVKSK